ncbi:hypothetical protein CN692_23765 [Bacillus sp. AFS002410]|uniref:hypothetical protein n=1 Tax=Bacillus sp. AFS002410 TaxID=2033481 RepID=UPI000BF05ED6|nr:hypothetical protein [Bacillus sp. AFS002410]PEJ48477.1 hypothetical protein CN692_23765 [Bacillus sp. AFS002410]
MKWGSFICTTVIVALIFFFEWKKMKLASKEDQIGFVLILLLAWIFSLFNLQQMAGPITWVEALFKPFEKYM